VTGVSAADREDEFEGTAEAAESATGEVLAGAGRLIPTGTAAARATGRDVRNTRIRPDA
jgi:hypothetical protein